MKFIEEIKDFFYFTKGERNGIFFLIILIVLVAIAPLVYLHYYPNHTYNNQDFAKEIIAFEKSLKQNDKQSYQNRLDKYIEERYDTLELFYFDPNTATNESLKKLGLSKKQISTINNYRNKGGKFFTKDDFRKIYGIRQNQFLKLKPYILLADKIQKTQSSNSSNEKLNIKDSLFYFDPNTISSEKLSLLGLNSKQIKTIENYRTQGGIFYKKEDFKKIYGINEVTYNKLAPYIKIEQLTTNKQKIITQNIDINSASFNELVKIKGIGKYLANNIIWYRNKLGGFVKKEQLLEIKNFRKSTYDNISTQIIIDTDKIKKININFAEISELSKHPYLNYKQAKAIVNYRTKNGSYSQINILQKKKLIPQEIFNKIKYYLTVK